MSPTKRNHYVPQWYQRRFLSPGNDKFFYLDLKPDSVTNNGKKYTRNSLLRWGPKRCFYRDDLYTLKLGSRADDVVERFFFGPIDNFGERAVAFMSDYTMSEPARDAFHHIMPYMDAQRLRTPRGLDWLRQATNVSNHNQLLYALRRLFQLNATMWTEGVWEVVNATDSRIKFIISDNPVTYYNARIFPLSPKIPYPIDADLSLVGTRTIFPLSMERCLIITHLQLVREIDRNPISARTNARSYESAMFDLRSIQTGRELSDDEVLRINYIIKKRADRYVAAQDADWLYPEKFVSEDHWSKLDADLFLRPNPYKVSFSTGIVVGYNNGTSYVRDEYGRRRSDPNYQNEGQRRSEMDSAEKSKRKWAMARKDKPTSRSHSDWNDATDRIMARDITKLKENETARKARAREQITR